MKEGFIIEKSTKQIYDRIFKRIFSLSNVAIINLINGLFHMDFPLDSTVTYPNKEFVTPGLKDRFADVIVIINGIHTFHLEAQMTKDERIVLRVFEYEFFYAMSQWSEDNTLHFPKPMVIYLDNQPEIPEESILHISFGNQGMFDYKVQNYMYLQHDVAELNQKKMIVLIPFQLLKLRNLIHQLLPSSQEEISSLALEDMNKINLLQEALKHDIIGSIEANVQFGNITMDDAKQLLELTELLYAHICADLEKAGGCKEMKPLLDGAIELPNDKYRFRIDELEKENAKYADEIAKYADEIARLKKRIEELETQK